MKRAFPSIVALWAVYALAVQFVAILALRYFHISPDPIANAHLVAGLREYMADPHHPYLARWDSFFYADIADHGYSFSTARLYNNVAFHPLYGLLMRWLGPFVHLTSLEVGAWISRFCLLGSMCFFLAYFPSNPSTGRPNWRPLYALLASPSAFILLAVYAESLFLFLALGTFWAYRRRRYRLSAVFAFSAALTRIHGIALPPALLTAAILETEQTGFNRARLQKFLPPAAALAGCLAPCVYFKIRFGNPWMFFVAQKGWGHAAAAPWIPFLDAFSLVAATLRGHPAPDLYRYVNLLSAAFILAGLVFLARRREWSEALFVAVCFSLPLSIGWFGGLPRYTAFLFPLYRMFLSRDGENSVDGTLWRTYLIMSVILQFALICVYVTLFYPPP